MKTKYLKILVAVLVFLTVGTLSFARDSAIDYSKDLEFIESLGISSKGEFKAEHVLTRSEFARLAANTLQFPSMGTNYELPFADVPKSDKNYGYISAAHSAGLINGGADSNFYPDREITFAEAYTISVRMLGYDVIARVKYNSFYDLMARELEIDADLYGALTDTLTAGEAAKLLTNVLSSDRLIISGIVDNTLDYNTSRQSLLELKYDAYKITGLLEQNEFTNIYTSTASCKRGEVLISGISYQTGLSGAMNYLGMNVDAYVTSDKKTILNIRASEDNKVNDFTSRQIDTITSNEVWYEKGDKDFAKIKLSPTVKLVLNSKAVSFNQTNITSLLNAQYTEYRLIDNNGDSTVDVIIAYTYSVKIVDYVSEISNSILAKNEQTPMIFDPEDDEIYFEFIKNGKITSIADLKEWNVLLCSLSDTTLPGTEYARIYVYTDTVYGKLTEIGEDYIKVDDKKYNTIKGFTSSVILNSEGDFYLDENGIVLAFKRQVRDVIGYMPYSIIAKGAFGDYMCRIFTENNRWVTLDLANKVKLNGDTQTAEYVKNNLTFPQLIEYRVNELGEVVSINEAEPALFYDKTAPGFSDRVKAERQLLPPGQFDSLIEQKTFRINYDASDFQYWDDDSTKSNRIRQLRYRSNGKTLETYIGLSTDTLFFFVPSDVSMEENYAIFSRDDLKSDQYYTVDIYNSDKTNIAGIAVFTGSSQAPGQNAGGANNMIIVDEIAQMLVNDESCYAIKGYANGSSVLIPISSTYTPQDLGIDTSKFNIINVNYNSQGTVNSVTHIYSSPYDVKTVISRDGSKNDELAGSTKFYNSDIIFRDSSVYLAAAEVISNNVEQNKIYVKYYDADYNGNHTVRYGVLDTASVGAITLYEKFGDREKVALGGITDIVPGDYIVCSAKWACANQIIVLK